MTMPTGLGAFFNSNVEYRCTLRGAVQPRPVLVYLLFVAAPNKAHRHG